MVKIGLTFLCVDPQIVNKLWIKIVENENDCGGKFSGRQNKRTTKNMLDIYIYIYAQCPLVQRVELTKLHAYLYVFYAQMTLLVKFRRSQMNCLSNVALTYI